jgi:VWFA-related protein
MTKLAAAVLLGIAAGQSVAGQATRPQPTFRSEVNYVEVDVVVTDGQGRFVPGLTAADFEVTDAGKRQSIEVLHEINVPVEQADRPFLSSTTLASDIASNESSAEGRVYVLLLDDLHTSPGNAYHVRQRAREFIERYVGSNDLTAVAHTSGRREVAQDFTSNRALLLAAVDGFIGRGLSSGLTSRLEDFQRRRVGLSNQVARDYDARERLEMARVTFDSMRSLAAAVAPLSGRRKALLLFSEGMDLDIESALTLEAQSASLLHVQDARNALTEAISIATRANMHVYTIDARGLGTENISAEVGTLPLWADAGLLPKDFTNERRRIQGTLMTLAEQTGGISIVNTRNFAGGFARIQQENSTYYLLGFYPSTKRDGKFHQLTVRARRPGLQVRARAGYHAAKGSGSTARSSNDPFAEMLRAPVPTPGLPMRMSLPVFKGTGSAATVIMAIDVPKDAFLFEPVGDVWAEDLELRYQVVDTAAKAVVSQAQNIRLRLNREALALVENRGYRIVIPLQIEPGRYQVRFAALTANAGMRGSVFADLSVPDFSEPGLWWSGVSLTSTGALEMPTGPIERALTAHIPVIPAARRTFAVNDTLMLYAEAYDNGPAGGHVVDVTAVIRDDTGKAVFTSSDVRTDSQLDGGRTGYGLRSDIPLRGLPPGLYVLTLTARSSASGKETASRDIPFAIS